LMEQDHFRHEAVFEGSAVSSLPGMQICA
jgi:hypothetical protein